MNRHDASVHDARPDEKPDETEMTERFPRSAEEKDTEREIDADHHLLVVRLVRLPPPPSWPKKHQRPEGDADGPKRDERDL